MQACAASGPILVGVSGGADSVALCRILMMLNFEVRVAHLDHAVRVDSGADAEWVSAWAAALGLPACVRRLPVARGSGFEARARTARLAFLRDAAYHFGCRFVALGHQQDDQAETVLFRLIRGAGPQGLTGIPSHRSFAADLTLVHPLLGVSRGELVSFLQALGQNWRDDPSNQTLDYARNQIRHTVLPHLTAINAAAGRHIAEAAATLQLEEAHWADWFARACHYYARALGPDGVEFDRAAFLSLTPAEQARMLRGWCQVQGWPLPCRVVLLQLCALAVQGGQADLQGGWRAVGVGDVLILERRAVCSDSQPLRELGSQPTADWGWSISASVSHSPQNSRWRCGLPRAALEEGWEWRSARPLSDVFVPQGRSRPHSLRHWFNRQGVPQHHQRHLLVLAQGDTVAWVVGYGVTGLDRSLGAASDGVQMQATACFQV